MTLQDWLAANPTVFSQRYPLTWTDSRCVQVFHFDAPQGERWQLWHLSDYAVSSVVSGPSVILVPRARS